MRCTVSRCIGAMPCRATRLRWPCVLSSAVQCLLRILSATRRSACGYLARSLCWRKQNLPEKLLGRHDAERDPAGHGRLRAKITGIGRGGGDRQDRSGRELQRRHLQHMRLLDFQFRRRFHRAVERLARRLGHRSARRARRRRGRRGLTGDYVALGRQRHFRDAVIVPRLNRQGNPGLRRHALPHPAEGQAHARGQIVFQPHRHRRRQRHEVRPLPDQFDLELYGRFLHPIEPE